MVPLRAATALTHAPTCQPASQPALAGTKKSLYFAPAFALLSVAQVEGT